MVGMLLGLIIGFIMYRIGYEKGIGDYKEHLWKEQWKIRKLPIVENLYKPYSEN